LYIADYSATDYSHHYMGSILQNLEKRMTALTIGEVAELLRVSDDTLRRQVKRREIPFFRVGCRFVSIRNALQSGLNIARSFPASLFLGLAADG
jgi:excisionase family DNA binding protein